MFGFLEVEDDPEALAALLDAAAGWLVARGPRPHGRPHGLHDERRVRRPDRGLRARAARSSSPGTRRTTPRAARGGRDGEGDGPLHVGARDLRPREDAADPLRPRRRPRARARRAHPQMSSGACAREMDRFAEVYNSAWRENWGFVPYSKEDLDCYAAELRLVFDKPWFMVAERDDETVAMAISVPDINQVLREDERADPAVRLVALPAAQEIIDRVPRRLPRASSPSTSTPASPRRSTSSTSTSPRARRSSGARWAGSSRPTAR